MIYQSGRGFIITIHVLQRLVSVKYYVQSCSAFCGQGHLKDQFTGYYFPRFSQGFTQTSLFGSFFLGISLRKKGRERHEGFSFRARMHSLMASLITFRGKKKWENEPHAMFYVLCIHKVERFDHSPSPSLPSTSVDLP